MTFARTKIQPPQSRSAFIARGAMQTRLARALREQRVALLVAPAGYGKTMLLAHEVARLPPGTAIAWVSADAGDDLQRLLECMLAALEPYDPPWRTAPESLVARVADSTDAQRDVAAEIINTIDASDVARGVIVFDDMHRIEDRDFFRFLERLIERLGARWCLALASRTEPPLALARLRAADELAEFRQLELQFARDEARELARGSGIDTALADRLFDRTQGWPAGMRIAIGAASGRSSMSNPDPLRASERPLFEFLVTEVLQQLPPALADFLLAVSVLPELDVARCRAVTDDRQTAVHLDEIERLGLFVDVLDAPGRTLRLHDLFRDALQLRLRQQDAARLAELQRRAAESEPDPVRRLTLLLQAGATDAAAALAFDHLPVLIPAAGPTTALHWIAQFPADAREHAPELAFVRGLAAWSQWDFPTMLAELERAERGFTARGDWRAEVARAEALMGLIAIGRIAEAADRLKSLRGRPLPAVTELLVLNAEIWLAIDAFRYSDAAPLFARLLDVVQSQEDRPDLWYQSTPALRMPGLPGMNPVLARYAERLLQVGGDAPTPLRTLALLTQAWCALWAGRLADARQLVRASRDEAQWSGHSGAVRAHLATLSALLSVIAGDAAAAAEAIIERQDVYGTRATAWHRYIVAIFGARMAACCADLTRTQRAWDEVEAARTAIGALATVEGVRSREGSIAAQLKWLGGKHDDAITGWKGLLEHEAEIDLQGQAAEVRVRLARGLVRRGDLNGAASCLIPVFARVPRDGGPGGALLAPDALRELAAVSWGPALAPRQQETLKSWWSAIAADRASVGAVPAGNKRAADGAPALTVRELEVLQRIAAGDNNKLIARAFDLSLHTVKRHVANILGKLGVGTRGQAAAWYRANAPAISK